MQKGHFKVGGNWYNTEEWSARARDSGLLVTIARNGVPCGEIKINKDDAAQYKKLIRDLVNDIYHIDVSPLIVQRFIRASNVMPEYERGVKRALNHFSGKNILYFEEGFENSFDVDLESLTIAYGDKFTQVLLTTGGEIGMPVIDFLLLYKGAKEPNHLVLSEWTGIPAGSLETVYYILVNLLYEYLKKDSSQ